jgi:hypothetical protein
MRVADEWEVGGPAGPPEGWFPDIADEATVAGLLAELERQAGGACWVAPVTPDPRPVRWCCYRWMGDGASRGIFGATRGEAVFGALVDCLIGEGP